MATRTKAHFLWQLRFHLLWRMNGAEAEAILSDCEDAFTEGKSIGETEQAVSARLGTPSSICKKASKGHIYKWLPLQRCLTTALFTAVIGWAFSIQFFRGADLFRISITPEQACPYILLIAMLYPLLVRAIIHPYYGNHPPDKTQSIVFGIIVILLTAASVGFAFYYCMHQERAIQTAALVGYVDIQALTDPLWYYGTVLWLLLATAVLFLNHWGTLLFPTLFLLTGSFSGLNLLSLSCDYIDPNNPPSNYLFVCLLPCLVGGILSVAAFLRRGQMQAGKLTIRTQKRFLQALRMTLFWQVSRSESEEILDDYTEFFISGLAEGKTEEELCKQFGRPSMIVRRLADGERQKLPIGKLFLAGLLLSTLVALFFPLLFVLPSPFVNMHGISYIISTSLSTIVAPLLIWFFMEGLLPHTTENKPSHQQKGRFLPSILFLFLLLCDVVLFLLFFLPIRTFISEPNASGFYLPNHHYVPLEEVGAVLTATGIVIALLFLCCLVVCILWFPYVYRRILPCVCLIITTLCVLSQNLDLCRQLDNPEIVLDALSYQIPSVLCGLVTATVLWGIDWFRKHKKAG